MRYNVWFSQIGSQLHITSKKINYFLRKKVIILCNLSYKQLSYPNSGEAMELCHVQ